MIPIMTPELRKAFEGWERDATVLNGAAPTPSPSGTPIPLPRVWMDQEGLHLVLTKWHLWQLGWSVLDGLILGLSAFLVYVLIREYRERDLP